jgi:hypothetical protein
MYPELWNAQWQIGQLRRASANGGTLGETQAASEASKPAWIGETAAPRYSRPRHPRWMTILRWVVVGFVLGGLLVMGALPAHAGSTPDRTLSVETLASSPAGGGGMPAVAWPKSRCRARGGLT